MRRKEKLTAVRTTMGGGGHDSRIGCVLDCSFIPFCCQCAVPPTERQRRQLQQQLFRQCTDHECILQTGAADFYSTVKIMLELISKIARFPEL